MLISPALYRDILFLDLLRSGMSEDAAWAESWRLTAEALEAQRLSYEAAEAEHTRRIVQVCNDLV
jgi:hypothetical protein